jgi:hypothetical protein
MPSTNRIEKLTPAQEALIPIIRDRAIQRALFDKPEVDVKRAREAINWLYEKAGKRTPKYFISVSSPLALQFAANLLKNHGAQVGAQVWAQVRDQVGDQVRDQVWAQVWDQVWAQKIEFYSWAYTGLGWDAYWFPFGEYFKEIGVLKYQDFEQYAEILESGIFMSLQFENCAIVCERPQIIHRNETHQLHYDQGPAIKWRDGYEMYLLFGVRFEKELYWKIINQEITIKDMMENIPNADQRSVALVMAEPKKLLKHVNAKLVSTGKKPTRAKEPTRLYEIPNFLDTGETEFCMTMACPSTARPFLEWVLPEIGRKHDADLAQAVAFQITKEQYMAIPPDQEA